jgi:hypothetical protein
VTFVLAQHVDDVWSAALEPAANGRRTAKKPAAGLASTNGPSVRAGAERRSGRPRGGAEPGKPARKTARRRAGK